MLVTKRKNWKGAAYMSEEKTVKELPACPVETTLTLIGDKWKG